jgi:hypothetical protein
MCTRGSFWSRNSVYPLPVDHSSRRFGEEKRPQLKLSGVRRLGIKRGELMVSIRVGVFWRCIHCMVYVCDRKCHICGRDETDWREGALNNSSKNQLPRQKPTMIHSVPIAMLSNCFTSLEKGVSNDLQSTLQSTT